jgi:hypothetical protein
MDAYFTFTGLNTKISPFSFNPITSDGGMGANHFTLETEDSSTGVSPHVIENTDPDKFKICLIGRFST